MTDHTNTDNGPCLAYALRETLADHLDAAPETTAIGIAASLGCLLGEIIHMATEAGKPPEYCAALIHAAMQAAQDVNNAMTAEAAPARHPAAVH